MREILFRGKREDCGEWCFGSLCKMFDGYHICDTYGTAERVIPETVGQYTGLTDKNGNKIFEGDIVKDNRLEEVLLCYVRKKARSGIAIVKFGLHGIPSEDPFCWGSAYGFYFDGDTLFPTPAQYFPFDKWSKSEFEIIGNIHDNPEIMEK